MRSRRNAAWHALVLSRSRQSWQEGGSHRGARVLDLPIAATALAMQLPLYTRNPDDFAGLDELIEIVAV